MKNGGGLSLSIDTLLLSLMSDTVYSMFCFSFSKTKPTCTCKNWHQEVVEVKLLDWNEVVISGWRLSIEIEVRLKFCARAEAVRLKGVWNFRLEAKPWDWKVVTLRKNPSCITLSSSYHSPLLSCSAGGDRSQIQQGFILLWIIQKKRNLIKVKQIFSWITPGMN